MWLDLDQEALDDAYDQAVYAFNSRNIAERHAASNEKALAVIGKPERRAYGPTDIEKVDIYRTKRPNAPTVIFIHGGAWRGGRSADFALYAEVFVREATESHLFPASRTAVHLDQATQWADVRPWRNFAAVT